MAQELGKIERPAAEAYEGKRKLFLVPLVYSPADPPKEYVGMLERYWAGVRNQLRRLVERTGPVQHIYHEAVAQSGDEGTRLIEQLNPRSHALVAEYLQNGAQIEALEEAEAFNEAIDWQRVLLMGPASQRVLDLAMTGYRDATKRRYDSMARRIDQTLKGDESGILLTPEEHGIQFSKDIQVFYVSPPALDEIHRWLRDRERQRPPSEDAPPEESSPSAAEAKASTG